MKLEGKDEKWSGGEGVGVQSAKHYTIELCYVVIWIFILNARLPGKYKPKNSGLSWKTRDQAFGRSISMEQMN